MFQCVDFARWGQIENIVHFLYVVKGHQLEGPDGVIKLMEDRHGFRATKSQYEKYFKEWGFRKKRTKEDYKIVGQKIESRKKRGLDSDVYLDGQLMPRKKLQKEISRQGYMTFAEQFNQAQATSPQTPPGFQIHTPCAQPLLRLVFKNLPILRFQETIQFFNESIKAFDPNVTALMSLLGNPHSSKNFDPILPIINSLLPNSTLLDEATASGVAIERIEQLGMTEFLNLTTFLISNNFPGEASGENLYKWLKDHGSTSVLKVLSSIKGHTAQAFLEKLFRLAVEAGDLPTVKYLLKAGVNPNGHNCVHAEIPDAMTPLQFACITGNSKLAQELIKAGSSIDEPGSGWKSSALVLAIIGSNFWYDGIEEAVDRDTSDVSDYEDDSGLENDANSQLDGTNQNDSDNLLSLVISLIDAGASIEVEDLNSFATPQDEYKDWDLDIRVDSLLHDGHSPLTAASKYRNKEVVDLLLMHGADVEFLTNRGTSALQECLYSWEGMKSDFQDCQRTTEPSLLNLNDRQPLFRGCQSKSKIISLVQTLLDAGADVNLSTFYKFDDYEDDESYDEDYIIFSSPFSPIDLAICTGIHEVVEMLLCGGAIATEHSLEVALHIRHPAAFGRLLRTAAPVSENLL